MVGLEEFGIFGGEFFCEFLINCVDLFVVIEEF